MLGRVRARVTYANVMSTVAAFVALGGSSYTALTVTGKNVKDSSLTGRDVRNGSLAGGDVRNRSLTGGDVRDRSLTGKDVRDASLLAADFAPNQLPAGPKGDRGEKGDPGAPGPAGILANSFVYSAENINLPENAEASQVSLLSSNDPKVSGGTLKLTQPARLHAEAMAVLIKRTAGAGGAAFCALFANGTPFSVSATTTFADAGNDAGGNPALPTDTVPIVGTLDVDPGTYNVGIRCSGDRPNHVSLRRAELHVVAYLR